MQRVFKGFNWLAAGILCWALIVASTQPVTFFADRNWVKPGVMLILAGGLLLAWHGGRQWTRSWSARTYRRVLVGLFILILLVQGLVAWQFVDVGRADSYFVRNQAIAIAHGQTTWPHYFAVYPNNVNYTLVASLSLKGLLSLGINPPWLILNLGRFLWVDLALVAGCYLLWTWHHWQPGALSFMLIWLGSVPIYAYALFAYTDAIVLPIPLLSLALGVWTKRHTGWQRWIGGLSGLLLVSFGVWLKSNLIVVWIAVMLILLIAVIRHHWHWAWPVLAILTLSGWWLGFHLWAQASGYHRQTQDALPATSWIAMSLNPQLAGQYNYTDFNQVNRQPTATAKKATTQAMIKQRLQQLGISGGLQHLLQKFRVFWATGDFDSFRLTTQWIRAPQWFLNHQRAIQFWLVTWTQAIFLCLLIGSLWTWFSAKQHQLSLGYLALIVIGLTVFHVVFWEVEARYAVPLLPILMLLASDATATVPTWSWLREGNHRWLVSWLMVLGVSFSGISILKTTQTTSTVASVVARQGNGAYFKVTTATLPAHQTVTLKLPINHRHNQLELVPASHQGKVQLTLQQAGQVIKRVTGTPKQVAKIAYQTCPAGTLVVTIKNLGHKAIHYQAATTNYNQRTGHVLTRSQLAWRYFVLDHRPAQALTRLRTIGLNLLLWLVIVLISLWWQPRQLD